MKKIISYLNYLCYNVIRIGKVFKVNKGSESNMDNNNRGILDTRDFAQYIKTIYKKKYLKDISPIKLQKSMYFCFAYWGGFISSSQGTEGTFNLSPYLFDATFEAWSYGPVLPRIYQQEQHGNSSREVTEEELFANTEDIVRDTVNSLLYDLFEISDFKLVNISHADKCWQNSYNYDDARHNGRINNDDIIREYSYKY